MSKIRKILAPVLIMLFLLAAALAFLPVSAAATGFLPQPELLVPTDGYVKFNDLKGIEADPGEDLEKADDDILYILDGKYLDRPARILTYQQGKISLFAELAGRPSFITRSSRYLFVYDRNQVMAVEIENPERMIPLTHINYCLSLAAIDNTLYVSTGESIVKYDVTDLTASSQPAGVTLVTGLNQAANLTPYLQNGAWQLLYDDQYEPRYGIHSVNTVTGDVLHLNYDTFFTGPSAMAASSERAFIAHSDGIYHMKLGEGKANVENILPINPNNPMTEGNLRQADSLQYVPGVNSLYVMDNISKAIQRFHVNAAGKLSYDNFRLASFGSDAGKLDTPQDITEQGGKRYILDSGNERVQVFHGDTVTVLPLASMGVAGNARRLTVDTAGNLYIATESSLFKATAAGEKIAEITGYRDISSLAHADNTVYFAAGKNVYRLLPDSTEPALVCSLTENVAAVAPTLKNDHILVATQRVITCYTTDGKSVGAATLAGEESGEAVVDMDIDFKDTLFILTNAPAVYKMTVSISDTGAELVSERAEADLSTVSDGNIQVLGTIPSAVALDTASGEVLFLYPNNHLAAMFAKSVLNAATFSDIPLLNPPVNILDRQPNDGETFPAIVAGWPSTILYPVSDSLAGTENYPAGFCYTGSDIRILESGAQVLVLGEADNYYYILYDNRAGFILKNAVNRPPELLPSYTDALILHDRSNVYKFPSTAKNGGEYAFLVESLAKDTEIKIINKVADFKDSSDILWYKISYGGTKFGYLARENATQNVQWDSRVDEKYGKIKADIAKGTVGVYDTTSQDSTPFTQLRDATRVRVFKDYGNGWLYIQAEDVNGKLINGYVESRHVTFEALTTSQIVGISLLVSVAVLLIAALILYTIFKSRAKGKPTVK